MQSIAKGNALRISSMKLRKVARLVKDMNADKALALLSMMPQKGAKMVYKVLHSAKANFVHKNPNEDVSSLYVQTIFVNDGTSFARFKPRARGRADRMYRPTAHLTLMLDNQKENQ